MRGIPSLPLDSTHGQTTSGETCNHRPWTTRMVEQHQAWHDITTLGLQARSDDVGRGMTSPPLDCTHGRMRSIMACHQRPWTAHTVRRRPVWHSITALGQHTRSNNIGVTCHHRLWQYTRSNDVECGMQKSRLGSTHGRTMSRMACHHRILGSIDSRMSSDVA